MLAFKFLEGLAKNLLEEKHLQNIALFSKKGDDVTKFWASKTITNLLSDGTLIPCPLINFLQTITRYMCYRP